jgi:hypothetical protein
MAPSRRQAHATRIGQGRNVRRVRSPSSLASSLKCKDGTSKNRLRVGSAPNQALNRDAGASMFSRAGGGLRLRRFSPYAS